MLAFDLIYIEFAFDYIFGNDGLLGYILFEFAFDYIFGNDVQTCFIN